MSKVDLAESGIWKETEREKCFCGLVRVAVRAVGPWAVSDRCPKWVPKAQIGERWGLRARLAWMCTETASTGMAR